MTAKGADVCGWDDKGHWVHSPLCVPWDRRCKSPVEHAYVSTACQHGLHDRCRQVCKFCDARCRCSHHASAFREPAPAKGYKCLCGFTTDAAHELADHSKRCRKAPRPAAADAAREKGEDVLPDSELARIEALAEAATPGEWREDGGIVATTDEAYMGREEDIIAEDVVRNEDAAFIAAARTAVPKLVAALRGARRENAELTHHLVADMGNAAEVERKSTEAAEQRAEAAERVNIGLARDFHNQQARLNAAESERDALRERAEKAEGDLKVARDIINSLHHHAELAFERGRR